MRRVWILVAVVVALLTQKGDAQSVRIAWDSPAPADGFTYQAFRVYNSATGPDSGHVVQTATAEDLSALVPTVPDVENRIWVTTYAAKWTEAGVELVEGEPSNVVTVTPTSPTQPSPDGTVSTSIVDCGGGRWTLRGDGATLRDDVWMGGGVGSVYKLLDCRVWVRGSDAQWYRWNGSVWEWMQSWEPGTTPPALSATFPAPIAVTSTTEPVPVAFPDPQASLGVPPYLMYCAPASGSPFYFGGTQVACTVFDAFGQIVTGGFSVTVTRADPPPPPPPADTTAPVVAIQASRNGKSANWTVSAQASDAGGLVSLVITINGAKPYACPAPYESCSATLKLPRGTLTLTATATDTAGNVGQDSEQVTN